MRFISALLFFLALSPMLLRAANPLPAKTAAQQAAAASPGQNDIQQLREDIQRMKNLVQQMEMNLAFVDTTQSPLKHQFQMEIDLWKTVIGQMERRLNSSKTR